MNHQYQQLRATWLKIQTKPQQRNSGQPGHCLWLQNKHYVLLHGSASALRGERQTVGKQRRRVWRLLPLAFVTQLPKPQVFFVLITFGRLCSRLLAHQKENLYTVWMNELLAFCSYEYQLAMETNNRQAIDLLEHRQLFMGHKNFQLPGKQWQHSPFFWMQNR